MDTHPLATVTVANRSQLFPIQRIATTHTHSVMGAFSPRPVTVMQPLNFLKNPLHPMPLFPSLLGNLSVQTLSHVQLSEIPWTAAHQASLSITNSWSLLKLMSIELVIPPNHHPLSSPSPLVFNLSQHQVFSSESVLCIRRPKDWSFSFSISPSNEYSGLIFFRMDQLYLLAVQKTKESSPTPQFKSINSLALSFLYGPTLTSVHGHWKNHSLD